MTRIILNSYTPIIGATATLAVGAGELIHKLMYSVPHLLWYQLPNGSIDGLLQYPFVALIVYFSLKAAQIWMQNSREWREAMTTQTESTVSKLIAAQEERNKEVLDRLESMANTVAATSEKIAVCPFIEDDKPTRTSAQKKGKN